MTLDLTRSTALTTITVRADGADLPGTFALLSLEISRVAGAIPYASLIYQDGDPARQTFETANAEMLRPGATIEIDLGYDSDESLAFRGVLTRLRIEAPQHGSSRLYVEAKHPAFRMHHLRASRVWVDTTDADAVADLAAAHGIDFDGGSEAKRGQLVQHQASDWDFAVLRAERIGQLLIGTDDGLRMFTPDLAAEPVGTLEYGRSLYSLDLELNAEGQAADVSVGAWSPADAAIETAESAPGDVPGPGNIDGNALAGVAARTTRPRHAGARDAAELDDWARAETLRRRLSAVTGMAEIQGTTEIAVSDMVTLAGLGARFEGAAFVSGLRHMLSEGDWRTFVQLGLDPAFHDARHDVSAPGAAGLVPKVTGLQIGTVDALQGDPKGEGRVAVSVATETGTTEPVWARPLSIGGGRDHGLVLLPDEKSECLLGFLDGDPRDPVLIGGLHSSDALSPLPGADGNAIKGFVSRMGLRLVFDDSGPSMTLETADKRRVVLSDAGNELALSDQSGNSVTLGQSGITLTSTADIAIKATGKVEIEGLSVSAKAQMSAEIEGGSSATLKSPGPVTIRGGMVHIN